MMRQFPETISNGKIIRSNRRRDKLQSSARLDRDLAAQIKRKATGTITDALPLTIVAAGPADRAGASQ